MFFVLSNESPLKNLAGVLPTVDVAETLRNFARANMKEVLTELYREDLSDAAFFTWLRARLAPMAREYLYLCSVCFGDGLDGMERLIRAQVVCTSILEVIISCI